jgi:hypothetical protein
MPSTYTSLLRLVKQANGENNNTWGTIFNQQFADLVDTALAGYSPIALSDANKTLTTANGAADESRPMVLDFTGALTANRDVVVPSTSKLYFVRNSTSGGYSLAFKTAAGTGVAVRNGGYAILVCDGTNVTDAITELAATTTINGSVVGYRDIPQRSLSADYTLVLGDAGYHLFHPSSDATARAWTIPANSSVAFPVGTAITFINDVGAGAITLSITGDTLVLSPTGATGTRSLPPAAVATAVKVSSTKWFISGTGIS